MSKQALILSLLVLATLAFSSLAEPVNPAPTPDLTADSAASAAVLSEAGGCEPIGLRQSPERLLRWQRLDLQEKRAEQLYLYTLRRDDQGVQRLG